MQVRPRLNRCVIFTHLEWCSRNMLVAALEVPPNSGTGTTPTKTTFFVARIIEPRQIEIRRRK